MWSQHFVVAVVSMMSSAKLKQSNSAVMPVESSPKRSNYSTAATMKAHSSSSFDPVSPVVSVLVQGRFGEFFPLMSALVVDI